jgi:MFS family permease
VISAVLPSRREARALLVGTLIAAVGQGMTLPFLFIYLNRVRGMDPTVVGLVVSWQGLMSLALAGLWGTLMDRHGPRRVVLPLYVVGAIGVGMYSLVHTPAQAFLAASLIATAGSSLWAGQNTMLSRVTDSDERQHVFGLNFAILNLGIGAGGVIAGFIANLHHPASFELLYRVNAATFVLPALILLALPGVGRPIPADPSHEASAGYREVLADRAFVRFVAFGLVMTAAGYAQIEIGYAAFANRVAGVEPRVIAWGLAANTVTIVLAQLFVLKALQGKSRSRALAVVGGFIAASWVVLGLGAHLRHVNPALPAIGVVLCAVVFACGETILSPVMPALTNALAPEALRGRYNAVGSMIWGVTAVVGPLTAAPLIGHGLSTVWLVLVVGGALTASLIALSLRPMLTEEQDGRLEEAAVRETVP